MFSLVMYTVIVFNVLFPHVSAMLVEDLESLFHTRNCIEASLISLHTSSEANIMLDSSSTVQAESSFNSTIKYDKSVSSKINELAQYNGLAIIYKLLSEEGPPHSKIYTVDLVIGDEHYEGSGSSLKSAKQAAAAVALENTLYEHPPEKMEMNEKKIETPTVILNNIAMKMGVAVTYYLLDGNDEYVIGSYGALDKPYGKSPYLKLNSSEPFKITNEESHISGPFMVRVDVGGTIFKGVGHTVQAARHDAATKALNDIEKQGLLKNNVCSSEETAEECKRKKESLKSPITQVYETAQKLNLGVEFNLIGESGKPHKKTFVMQCKVGGYTTEGEGGSKKESKVIAAERMLEFLPKMSQNFDEKAILNSLSEKKKKRKKKNKIIKTNSENLMHTVSNMISSIWTSNDKMLSIDDQVNSQKPGKTSKSAKDKLLELSSRLSIPVEFTDLSKHQDMFHSLVSLGVHPSHICWGKASTREKSHEVAALHGLKFLKGSGLFDKAEFIQLMQSIHMEDDLKLEYEEEKQMISFEKEEKTE